MSPDDAARQEAERRYRDRAQFASTPGAVRNARMEAFEHGAKWQREQPATEAEVEAPARVICDEPTMQEARLLRIQPGDKVILRHHGPLTYDEAGRIAAAAESYLGIPVLVLWDGIDIDVLRKKEG